MERKVKEEKKDWWARKFKQSQFEVGVDKKAAQKQNAFSDLLPVFWLNWLLSKDTAR